MSIEFKAQKGKTFEDLPNKTMETFENTEYFQSIKYDGNQIFIVKSGNTVRFYTSDWKPFHLSVVEAELINKEQDFILVGEFMHNCKGRLGDRVHSAKLTTYRTNFAKNVPNSSVDQLLTNIKVFDALELVGTTVRTNVKTRDRIAYMETLVKDCRYLSSVLFTKVLGKDAKDNTLEIVRRGWEGTMLIEVDSYYYPGKRVNHAIKLKGRRTADLLCVDTELGEGKYTDLIGSLILEDSKGRRVSVGSGLTDKDRLYHEDFYIGKVIEIEYEQILSTYIQPTYLRIRHDKTKGEID